MLKSSQAARRAGGALPLVTHSNNSIDRSLLDRQFENFEKRKNP
jgi:hypothetical protein